MTKKASQYIDLTHTLHNTIPAWDLDCGFNKKTVLDYSDCPGDEKFRLQSIACPAGIGTHMDAPAHCIAGAQSIEDIPLAQFFQRCAMIDVSEKADEHYKTNIDDILSFEAQHGKIEQHTFVIIHTGWSRHWDNPEHYHNRLQFPSLALEAAELLMTRNISGLGIDTLSPDSGGVHFPVHQVILGAGKYIIENIANANQLPPAGAEVIALPLKIEAGTEAPVRLIGLTKTDQTQ